jgi:two-component system NarL family sensor kinase
VAGSALRSAEKEVDEATTAKRRAGRRLVAVQVGWFALAGLVALVIVGVATLVASRRVGEREAIADARTRTVTKAQGIVEPALTDAVIDGDPAAKARFDAGIRRDVLDGSLVRVKLWDADGKIVYSDEPRLVDKTYSLGSDERAALQTGEIVASVTDLQKPENRYERSYGKLLEVYLPIESPSGRRVLFEAYYRFEPVAAKGRQLWRSFAPIALGALLLLELVQIPLAYSLARRLRLRSEEREALLQRTLEASDVERRHIASDLHDGVVQDLAGVAYTLSAATRRAASDGAPALSPEVAEQAAASVRGSVRDLRSLLIDIYPPDFAEVTLQSALADLLARAEEQGYTTELEVDVGSEPLPDAVARLLYRAAQEGLRNVVTHSHGSSVRVRVASVGSLVTLDVVDDGEGFDGATSDARRRGHFGLTALRDLVVESGGRVDVRSAPGAGTTLHVEVER